MTGPDFTKRNVPQPQFDPVTGAPLPGGPAAYSAVDPAQSADPFGYPGSAAGYAPQPYPTAGHRQGYPAYPAAGYPGGQQPPGYPGYAPAGYQMVPMYPVQQRPTKPGGATAAAVLAYVQSGFVLIGGLVMFSGSAGLSSLDRANGFSAELTVMGIITVLAGGLLIAGATTLLNRKPTLLMIGNLLSLAVSVYFVIRLIDFVNGIGLWAPISYAVLPIISLALASTAEVRAWTRARTYDQG